MDLSSLSATEKDELKKQLKAEMALATMRELITEMTERCYDKCISKPGSSLDSYEQRCLGNCMDRYLDSWNTVSKAFTATLVKNNQQ